MGRGGRPKRIKAAAYRYADGGPQSPELRLLYWIDRIGHSAVLGRPLYYHELIRMMVAEHIVNAYRARAASSDWAAWVRDNEADAQLLGDAESLANA